LHLVAEREPIFLFSEVIELIIDHTVLKKNMIVDARGECIGSFLEEHLEKYYRFMDPELHLVTPFVNEFYENNDVANILASWGRKRKNS